MSDTLILSRARGKLKLWTDGPRCRAKPGRLNSKRRNMMWVRAAAAQGVGQQKKEFARPGVLLTMPFGGPV